MSSSTILITGANRGLGLELTKQLLQKNWRVIGTSRSAPKPDDELTKLSQQYGDKLILVTMDVNDDASIEAAFKEVSGKVQSLEVLFNNAGILFHDDILTISRERFAETLQVNIVSVLKVTQIFLPLVKNSTSKPGVIVNMGSNLGSIANTQGAYASSYCVSKAGLNMLTQHLNLKLKPEGVVSYTQHPGWVDTDMGRSSGVTPPLTPLESVSGMVSVLEKVRADNGEKYGGAFLNHLGETLPW